MYASIDSVADRLVSTYSISNTSSLVLSICSACDYDFVYYSCANIIISHIKSLLQIHQSTKLMIQARKLRKYKERRLDGYHGGPNMGENLADVLNGLDADDDATEDEEETFIDPEQAVVTKVKR